MPNPNGPERRKILQSGIEPDVFQKNGTGRTEQALCQKIISFVAINNYGAVGKK